MSRPRAQSATRRTISPGLGSDQDDHPVGSLPRAFWSQVAQAPPAPPLSSWRTTHMSYTGYRLAPSVHWCTVHGLSVLLDVDNDRYLSVPAREFEALLPYFSGATSPAGTHTCAPPPALASLMNDLRARGLLISIPQTDAPKASVDLPPPDQIISATNTLLPVRAALRYAPAFIRSCLAADYRLRHRSLRQIISWVSQTRRSRHVPAAERLPYLTRIFHTLRPTYPRDYLCLFDSLALLEFLSHWRMLPHWVFGVHVDPFEAHCWVQHDTTVLCDTDAFRSRWYSRILVV